MAFSSGYDMRNEFLFSDGLGKTYIGIAAGWSILLACGCLFLGLNGELPFLRIRNVSLTVSAVAILHVYWVLCFIAYGLNGFFPCATEFWIMNIYLPLGIALFHLSNTKLLHVAVLQRRYVYASSTSSEEKSLIEHRSGWKKQVRTLQEHGTYTKTKWSIALGLVVQLAAALVIFFISRKFHRGFGIVGQAVLDSPTTKAECRRGWEWVPSIVWQFAWSWIYAPYLLWKVRKIQDTHGWRMQTTICCLAGLPGSPMWLLALYLPQMARVNRYFIPPMWFTPSILLIEAFMVFLPCWQILRHRRLKKETLEIIAQWEEQKKGTSTDMDSIPQSPRRISQKSSVSSAASSRKAHAHLYTSAALEKALQTNPTPLLLFAALKDFTGENISFLNHTREWKKNWSTPQRNTTLSESCLRYQQFVRAVEIYSSFVSLRYSSFPINISHTHLKALEIIFERAASTVNTDLDSLNSATPFDDFFVLSVDIEATKSRDEASILSASLDTTSIATKTDPKAIAKDSAVLNVYKVKELGDKLPQSLEIPPNFGPHVFDHAMESVQYMVLTNTWPKFVDAGFAANMIDKTTTVDKFQDRLAGCGIGRSRIVSF